MLLVPFSSALNLLPELTTISGDFVALQALGGTTGSAPPVSIPVSIASLFVAVRLSEPGPTTTGEEGDGDSMLMESMEGEGEGEPCASMREWPTLADASSSAAIRMREAMLEIMLTIWCSVNGTRAYIRSVDACSPQKRIPRKPL
jgi:hypothetical protein